MKNTHLMKRILYSACLLLASLFYSRCRQPETSNTPPVPMSDDTLDVTPPILTSDTLNVCGTPFRTFYDRANLVYLLTMKGDTVYHTQNYYHSAEVIDFNGDGCPDIWINVFGKANLTEILLFDNDAKIYRELQQSALPKAIADTDLWFEFEPAGCSSMRWISALYKLRNFKSFKIAEMLAVSCKGEKKGIFVSRIGPDGSAQQVEEFDLGPWEAGYDFVEDYWKKNYQKFE
jgi:hypothetical protein